MFSYRTLDDAGNPATVRWMWLQPHQSARARWPRLPEYALPPIVVLVALAGWLFLLKSQGPFVLAVTMFSPIASMLIFVFIAFGLWMLRCLARHARRCRSAELAMGRCPGCSYSLANLRPTNPSSTTHATCPECGTTWNLSPSRDQIETIQIQQPTLAGAEPVREPT